MRLRRLRIHQLRNLDEAELARTAQINIIHGANGSGKTSILEAIHLTGVGRPFRRAQFKPLIQHGAPELHVFAELSAREESPIIAIGLERTRNGINRTLLDGVKVASASVLAEILPLQVIDSSVFQLLEGGSERRREFMNWGMFHVKHNFREHWSRAMRCVRQRNTLLRDPEMDVEELATWSESLADSAVLIDDMRSAWFDAFKPFFNEVMAALQYPEYKSQELEMSYYRGWGDYNLHDKLLVDWEQERAAGFSRIGPHRAELRLKIHGQNASMLLSRGQMKLVAAALKLAQAEYLLSICAKHCIILVDDLAAELDKSARERFCRFLERSSHQIFVSCITLEDLHPFWQNHNDLAVFHVKHGKIFNDS
jgi:DNA replication and repair protein RecF